MAEPKAAKTTKVAPTKTVKKAQAPAPSEKKATAKKTPVAATLNTTKAAELTKKKTAAVRNTVSIEVLDTKGAVVETITLPGEIFAASVNPTLMAQAVRVYLANQRRGTVATKTRGEVEGSTRKIYRQKGTGRARHGSVRAPIFVGGGLVFGPKQRDYSLKMPQKMRRLALFSALTSKFQDKELIVIKGLETLEPKTKVMYEALKGTLDTKRPSVLLVVPVESKDNGNVRKSARNIEGVTFLPVNQLNTYEILQAKRIIFMQNALDSLTSVFGKEQ